MGGFRYSVMRRLEKPVLGKTDDVRLQTGSQVQAAEKIQRHSLHQCQLQLESKMDLWNQDL